jgi:hypothetical protein
MDAKHLLESIYQSGPYDLILCSEVLEHVDEWDNFFAILSPVGSVRTHYSHLPSFFHFMKSPMTCGVRHTMPSGFLRRNND